jgi:hypothetical protein
MAMVVAPIRAARARGRRRCPRAREGVRCGGLMQYEPLWSAPSGFQACDGIPFTPVPKLAQREIRGSLEIKLFFRSRTSAAKVPFCFGSERQRHRPRFSTPTQPPVPTTVSAIATRRALAHHTACRAPTPPASAHARTRGRRLAQRVAPSLPDVAAAWRCSAPRCSAAPGAARLPAAPVAAARHHCSSCCSTTTTITACCASPRALSQHPCCSCCHAARLTRSLGSAGSKHLARFSSTTTRASTSTPSSSHHERACRFLPIPLLPRSVTADPAARTLHPVSVNTTSLTFQPSRSLRPAEDPSPSSTRTRMRAPAPRAAARPGLVASRSVPCRTLPTPRSRRASLERSRSVHTPQLTDSRLSVRAASSRPDRPHSRAYARSVLYHRSIYSLVYSLRSKLSRTVAQFSNAASWGRPPATRAPSRRP